MLIHQKRSAPTPVPIFTLYANLERHCMCYATFVCLVCCSISILHAYKLVRFRNHNLLVNIFRTLHKNMVPFSQIYFYFSSSQSLCSISLLSTSTIFKAPPKKINRKILYSGVCYILRSFSRRVLFRAGD